MHPRPPTCCHGPQQGGRSSLDTTETLELELSNSHLTQGYTESDELQAQQEDSDEEEEGGRMGPRQSPISILNLQ